ncbi:CopG family transcriptional regulator [Stenomitos frigidus ULC18]|uniref:CopG family transcriptional regulator n=1 Tax=Stenomitos frigidus ULC18 TaxID=2107698 RepID=A0A2T1EBX2_9CYAN|nr:CopG family transcriptional regulator [Stenomitos frigidus ULC18]
MIFSDVATNKARLVAYCEPEVKEKLERLAESRLRSLSNLIESILVEEVAKAEASGELGTSPERKSP